MMPNQEILKEYRNKFSTWLIMTWRSVWAGEFFRCSDWQAYEVVGGN